MIAVQRENGYCISVSGVQLGKALAAEFAGEMHAFLDGAERAVLLDLQECSDIDSASLSVIVALNSFARKEGKKVTIRANPTIEAMLRALRPGVDWFCFESTQ